MAELIKEFKVFYNDEVKFSGNKVIRDKKKSLKDDFKSSFPKIFNEYFDGEFLAENIRFIDQGSYAIGTTINHGNKAYDIDVATILEIDYNTYGDPVEIKKLVRDALKNNKRNPIIKEPCVTVKYLSKGEEKYHLDFPVYANLNNSLCLARGYENSNEENKEWQLANPEGLTNYFKTDNLQIEGLGLSEEQKGQRKQKKRVIRYLKWWKAEKYSNPVSDNQVPPSIALTILTCKYFVSAKIDGEFNDLHSLYKTVDEIINMIFFDGYDENRNQIKKLKNCELPVVPYSDCFINIKKSNQHVQTFYSRLKNLKECLENAVNESCERKAGEEVVKMLGDSFPLLEEDTVNEEDSFA